MKTGFLLFALALGILLSGCAGGEAAPAESGTSPETVGKAVIGPSLPAGVEAPDSARRVEVIHFHGTHQCHSCITVGQYAEETINTYFSKEVEEGKVTFAHINGELPENREMVSKYGVKSASLWIGTYADEGFEKEENVMVWYKINDRDKYMEYLRGILEKKLAG